MNIRNLLEEIKSFQGFKNKQMVGKAIKLLKDAGFKSSHIFSSFGENSAALEIDSENLLLFHADSIVESLINADPWGAGFFSVAVNVNDINAAGGLPIALVYVVSYKTEEAGNKIFEGLTEATHRFQVPIVGGHTHPLSNRNIVAGGIIGKVDKNEFMSSGRAQPGDNILLSVDLEGKTYEHYPLGWDTLTMKTSAEILDKRKAIRKIAKYGYANACKDISNAGILGTLAMMLEHSNVGATVHLEPLQKVKPADISISKWLKMFITTGFIFSLKPENVNESLKIFEEHSLAASIIGTVDDSKVIKVSYANQNFKFLDLNYEGIIF